MATDLEIARAAQLRPIAEIAARASIPEEALIPYGRHKAKIDLDFVRAAESRPEGALVLVTGINPTAAGEGKTTTTIGLGDALNALEDGGGGGGTRTIVCLREPSLGPCFGTKGVPRAAGGRRWRRWRTSTSTSPATYTPSPPPTTCSPRSPTTTSTGATPSAWTRGASAGGARST
jgi:hypothetical protein